MRPTSHVQILMSVQKEHINVMNMQTVWTMMAAMTVYVTKAMMEMALTVMVSPSPLAELYYIYKPACLPVYRYEIIMNLLMQILMNVV